MQMVLVTGVVKLFYLIVLIPLLLLRTPSPAVFLNYATYSENHQPFGLMSFLHIYVVSLPVTPVSPDWARQGA